MATSTCRFRERSVALIAGTVLALSALGGCSGGSGGRGGGAGSIGAAFTYPDSLPKATSADSIVGFSSPASITGDVLTLKGNGNTSSGSTIRLTVSAPNQYTFTVIGLQPSPGITEPAFSFTVRSADVTIPLAVEGANCAGCFRSRTADGVEFIDLDLETAGLRYSTLGLWSKPSSVAGTEIGGALAFGVLTRNVDLPTSGTATYTGPFVGRYADGSTVYTVGAGAKAEADFAARSVAFSTLNTMKTPLSGGGGPELDKSLDLSGTLRWSAGSNALSSLPDGINSSSGMSGVAIGAFYGQPTRAATAPFNFAPPELGGVVSVTDGANQSMVGSFALKK